jgi:hypothetical protein
VVLNGGCAQSRGSVYLPTLNTRAVAALYITPSSIGTGAAAKEAKQVSAHSVLRKSSLSEKKTREAIMEGGAGASEKGKVLVTGASGFVGSWLVMKLLQAGYTVRATVRDPGEFVSIVLRTSSSCSQTLIRSVYICRVLIVLQRTLGRRSH